MAAQSYVGPVAATPEGVATRLSTEDQLAAGYSRSFADGRAATLAAAYATRNYVDTADAGFVDAAYVAGLDALNVPASSVGAANGVAPLDSSGKIPVVNCPTLGFGTLRGPWGVASTYGGTATNSTPQKFADFTIGATTWNFRPLVFLTVQVDVASNARPVVEVRIGTPSDTTYASQTLVGSSIGRAFYNDTQVLSVFPADALGAMSDGTQTYYGPNYDARLTVWVYNLSSTGAVTFGTGSVWTAAAFVARVAS
jgi:hypothetical protein